MHIFLVILKIIGITVLILLGIIVTLSLLILFVPVRYSVRADFDNDIRLSINLTWLARILQCRIGYPKGELWVVRLFGIPIARSGRVKRKNKRAGKKAVCDEKPVIEEANHDKADVNACKDNSDCHNANENRAGRTAENADAGKDGSGRTNCCRRKSKKKRQNKKQKKKKAYLKSLFGMISDDRNKRLIVFFKDIVIKFLKRVRPKKIMADVVIGFEDPAYTGLFFGGLGILTVCWKGKYNISPDFEKKILKGRVCAKGYVRFVHMLYFLLKILFNEDIKRVMKKGQVN